MYNPQITNYFRKYFKTIGKKDPQLKKILIETLKDFKKEQAISLGKGVYKIRIKRTGSGKSGGHRLLLFIEEEKKQIIPIFIYAKSEHQNISLQEMNDHLENTKSELKKYAIILG